MKKHFLFLLFLIIIPVQLFAQTSNSKGTGAKVVWQNTKHDFGKIPQGVPVSTTFKFKNTGNSPLIISNVKTSCGCTTPFYTKDPILPGKTGVIKAQYNAANPGVFNKSITVTTNSGSGTTVLYIKGEVIAD